MRRALFLLLFIGFFGLSGCNTVAGVGRDISGAGQALERTADYARTTPPSPEILADDEIELIYPPAVAPTPETPTDSFVK